MSALPQQRIQRFLAVLRDNGLRVAQQETSDAFKALALNIRSRGVLAIGARAAR